MQTIDANGNSSWEDIDRALRAVAMRRCALDAEEAALLRAALQCELWRELGKVSLLEYLEEVLGYSPRAASERVRVATALRELPDIADALERGELHWSAVRELTRIVTPETEAEWLDDAREKNLRQIEHAVSGRSKGDRPTDPERPNLRPVRLSFEVTPEALAIVRQMRQVLASERGEHIDDTAFFLAMGRAFLGGGGDAVSQRAPYQIMMSLCPVCEQGHQDVGGRRYAVDHATVERAMCDAQWVGSDTAPARATQDVTPKTRRFVFRRDGGKCCVPGCRSTRFLAFHHIEARADGGGHGHENITLICDGHHRALHEGKLSITGTAPDLVVRWLRPTPTPKPAAPTPSIVRAQEVAGSPELLGTHVGHREIAAPTAIAPPTGRPEPPTTHVGDGEIARPAPKSSHPRGPTPATASHSTHVGSASKFGIVVMKTEARMALVQLGYKKHEAATAIDAAVADLDSSMTLDALLRAALRHCSRTR